MKLSEFIDKCAELPMLPIAWTENNRKKSIRVIGVIVYIFWFFPAAVLWMIIMSVLAIPAMIQDA